MIAIVSNGGRLSELIAAQLLARGAATDAVKQVALDCKSNSKLDYQGADTLVMIPNAGGDESGIRLHNLALQAAKEQGVQRVILLSLSCAHSDSKALVTPFLLYNESSLRSSGLDWLILRRSLFIDSVEKWIQQLVVSGYLRYPLSGGLCSYVSMADVADSVAAACLSTRSEEVFELTGPAAINIIEFCNALSRCSDNAIEFRQIAEPDFSRQLACEGLSDNKSERLLSLLHAIDAGEFARASSHVEMLTGSPPESVLTALRRLKSR